MDTKPDSLVTHVTPTKKGYDDAFNDTVKEHFSMSEGAAHTPTFVVFFLSQIQNCSCADFIITKNH